MPQTFTKSALLIAGPTASGKSALALAQAKTRGGVIINADSMQVYRELRILSARPTAEEEAQAPHQLYGHVSGADDYSVGRWLADARTCMEACWRIGALPIVCGGTGLYFKALTDGLAEVPLIAEAVRQHWRGFTGDAHSELMLRDPLAAARLQPNDRQRIVRALEVVDGTGHSLAHWQAKGRAGAVLRDVNVEQMFVDVPREQLYGRADQRFDQMIRQGALEEVKALPPLDAMRPMMKAIGVPELQAHVRGELSLDEAVEKAKTATRHYVKRQLTWWRGNLQDWTLVRPS